MAQSGKIGVKCKLYYNTGTYGAPVWSEVNKVGDAMLKAEWGEGEANDRSSLAELALKTLLGLEFTFKMRKDAADVPFLAIDDAAAGVTILDFLVLDGDKATSLNRGYRFESQVYSHSESQNPGDVLYPEYKIKPAPTTNGPPARAVVTAGSPVFTSLAA